jgi:hypothetical protein
VARPPLYGLDIVIADVPADGSVPADDEAPYPSRHRVVAAGLSIPGADLRFDHGDEALLLGALDTELASLPAGVLVTWRGGVFELPLLAERADELAVRIGLHLRADVRRRSATEDRPVVCGRWHEHRHLDLARVYDPAGPALLRLGRRSDEALIPPPSGAVERDPCHDARLARCLAERRWARARRLIDRMAAAPGPVPDQPLDQRPARPA